jgi:hypothetical protein
VHGVRLESAPADRKRQPAGGNNRRLRRDFQPVFKPLRNEIFEKILRGPGRLGAGKNRGRKKERLICALRAYESAQETRFNSQQWLGDLDCQFVRNIGTTAKCVKAKSRFVPGLDSQFIRRV